MAQRTTKASANPAPAADQAERPSPAEGPQLRTTTPKCMVWLNRINKAKAPLDVAKADHAAQYSAIKDDPEYHAKAFKWFLTLMGMEPTARDALRDKLNAYCRDGKTFAQGGFFTTEPAA